MSNPAETYESYMVPALFAPWASRLVEAAAPRPGDRVLDVGCGTGIVARTVAPLVASHGHVTGIDPSPPMLEVARRRSAAAGLAIEWRRGRAEALPFPDASFDLVLSQFALMFFEAPDAALAEMRRVLKPAGRVLLSVFQEIERHPFYVELDTAIEARLGASGVRDIFSLGDAAGLRTLLAAAGFSRIELEHASMTARFPGPDGFLAGEIDVDTASVPSMQILDAEARRSVVEALKQEMAAPLAEVTQDGFVVLPFHVNVARCWP